MMGEFIGFRPAGTEEYSEEEEELCLIDNSTASSNHGVCENDHAHGESNKPSTIQSVHEYHKRAWSGLKNNQSPVSRSVDAKRDKQGSPLVVDDYRTAVCRGNLQEVTAFLSRGVLVDTPLRAGWTALMYAASYGHVQILEFVLGKGADVNFNKASYMYTPLIAAASSLQSKDQVTSCVTILLKKDANPNVHERSHMTPLMFASKNGNVDAVHKLLEFGAQTDRQDNRGWTALSYAADQGFKDVVECLLNAKADTHKKCSEGTAGDIALNRGHTELAELIDNTNSGGISAGKSARRNYTPQDSQPLGSSQIQNADSLSVNKISMSGERCDDLDLFLCGLDLGHLVPCFHQQDVNFSLLLRMSDKDLIKIGVDKYGWRCKILDALHEIHKRKWEPGSVRAPGNTILGRTESIALIKNISKHMAYIGSSMAYIGTNWRTHHTLLDTLQDPVNLQRLVVETDDALEKTVHLFEELRNLKGQLKQATNSEAVLPADLIVDPDAMPRVGRKLQSFLAIAAVTTTLLVLYRVPILERIMKTGM